MLLPSTARRTPGVFLRLAQQGLAAATLCLGGLASLMGQVQAAVPQAQRDALIALYNATNGPGWTNSSNWLVGDPCDNGWLGIGCGLGDTTVTRLDLGSNGLSGSLSPLVDLVDLVSVDLSGNQLGGSIPALNGLTALGFFNVSSNQLTGTLPDFSNLPSLFQFNASLNQLSGSIPPLAGLPSLVVFNVHTNQLTGAIPSLAGIAGLAYFTVDRNQLSGALPDLAGLANLGVFNVSSNQLSGSIPPLSGLASLGYFSVADNGLTGSVPSLADLNALQNFHVANNRLSGLLPTAPASLQAAGSSVCPNLFTLATGSANDLAWNTATGSSPWSSACVQPVVPVPTLHEVALAGLMLMLAGVAALRLRGSGKR
jgi:hypothetical protein